MKKKILGVIALLGICVPMLANAEEYKVDSDMSIDLDNESWYVFTRDNIKDNEELDELGLTYDYMDNLFNTNSLYLDASIFDTEEESFIELLVRKKEIADVKNFSSYSNDEVLKFAKELSKRTGSTDYTVYEVNGYKFAYSKYLDKNVGYYVLEYCTMVNGFNYTITVQKPTEFTEEEETYIKSVIDTVKYNVKESEEKEETSIADYAIVGAIAGATVALACGVIAKKRKKVSNTK